MKKKLLYIVLVSATIITGTSCNKWLTLQPQDGITRQEFWETKEQIQSAVTGCYASLLADPAGTDRPLPEYMFLWGELRSDMITGGFGVTNDENDLMTANVLPTNTLAKWSAVYKTINYCNTVVDFAPQVLNNDNTLTQTQLNAWLAEVRAMRAWLYFYLVRTFRDVPLKLKSTSSDLDLQQLAKTSGDSVLMQINADLAYADSNIVFSYGASATDKGRITKYTVKAMQADVFLWQDKYTEAAAACDFVINSGKFGLIKGDGGWFNTLYYTGNSNESIFELQYDAQRLNSFYTMFATNKQRFIATNYVMDQVYTIDLTNDQNYDIRGQGGAVRTSDNLIWKYVGFNYPSLRTQDISYAHWFVYRYADILLMKAEALIQLNRGSEALAYIYQVRKRANALVATDLNPSPADKNGLTDFLIAERAREFAFEGKRWFDVLRNSKRNSF